jgi:2-keto-4-pentenoate hydratase/2-oxohepta-3-ene-1,7-dioic acid hydratase in catechol pathway
MKLLRVGEQNLELPAILDGTGQLRDLSAQVRDFNPAWLAGGGIDKLRSIKLETLPVLNGSTRIGCPIGGIGKYVCVGLNYSDHAAESGLPIPAEPILFMKATSAIQGPNDDILIPPGSGKTDWEVELAIVIGQRARRVPLAQAANHIAGFCIANDVSERAYQLERGGQWDKGKGCDSFGPLGPWLVTADEVRTPQSLAMWLDVNGQRHQNSSTGMMIFDIPFLVHYISHFMTLEPGDVISTGTPPGVGMGLKPPRFLRAGDVVTLGIQGLGEQRQHVRDT